MRCVFLGVLPNLFSIGSQLFCSQYRELVHSRNKNAQNLDFVTDSTGTTSGIVRQLLEDGWHCHNQIRHKKMEIYITIASVCNRQQVIAIAFDF
jgi:hypothetical protein